MLRENWTFEPSTARYSYHSLVASCLMLVILSIFLGDYPKNGHLFHKCVQIGSWNHPTWGCNNNMPNLMTTSPWHGTSKTNDYHQLWDSKNRRKKVNPVRNSKISRICNWKHNGARVIFYCQFTSWCALVVSLNYANMWAIKKSLLLSIESWFFNRDP